jgi:hypothetical protein
MKVKTTIKAGQASSSNTVTQGNSSEVNVTQSNSSSIG